MNNQTDELEFHISDEFEDGAHAYGLKHLPKSANPYNPVTQEYSYNEWLDGWMYAYDCAA